MSLSDILKKKHQLIVHKLQTTAAKRLQTWWRNKGKKRGFATIGIWEIKKMLDKVMIIQKWYRGLVAKWDYRVRYAIKVRAVVVIQRLVRE